MPDLPPEARLDRLVSLLEPFSRVTQPKLYGLDRLPADGSLLVGNHTIYGLLDVPFMVAEVWKRRRIVIRGLGEHAHCAGAARRPRAPARTARAASAPRVGRRRGDARRAR